MYVPPFAANDKSGVNILSKRMVYKILELKKKKVNQRNLQFLSPGQNKRNALAGIFSALFKLFSQGRAKWAGFYKLLASLSMTWS